MAELRVEILGQRMVVSSPRGEDYLREIVEFVKKRLSRHTSRHPDSLKAAISACLEFAFEVYNLKEENIKFKEELGRRIEDILREIENEK